MKRNWCLYKSSLVRKRIWAPYPLMMFAVRVAASVSSPWLFKLVLWKNDGQNEIVGIWKWYISGLWGLRWFCLTSHQLSASTRFCCVEISLLCSLSHPALIILSQVHLPNRRRHSESCLIIVIISSSIIIIINILIRNFTINVFKKRSSCHLTCHR